MKSRQGLIKMIPGKGDVGNRWINLQEGKLGWPGRRLDKCEESIQMMNEGVNKIRSDQGIRGCWRRLRKRFAASLDEWLGSGWAQGSCVEPESFRDRHDWVLYQNRGELGGST